MKDLELKNQAGTDARILKIFLPKNRQKISVFDSKQS
jgi:hypothetical protein